MGSETTLRLPVIDFSKQDLEPGTRAWNSVKSQVLQALEEPSCATFPRSPSIYGYVGQYPHGPLYESMGIDDANVIEKVEELTKILWPEGNASFSLIIRRMILESFGLEKYMEEHMSSTNYLLRVMKYKGPQRTETKLGLNAHTDKNIVTILYRNEVDGLEVKTKTGEWINVKPSPDSLIAMMGDSLYAWLNGRLYPPYHRVMMAGDKARLRRRWWTTNILCCLSPLTILNSWGFTAYTEAGQRAESAVKTYGGV
ncbi:hypothetical protein SLA2020_254580 [Shorea laevis]